MREYLFSYRYDGTDWGISIFAEDEAQAKQKIKMVSLARYDGELMARLPAVVGGGIIARLICWWKNSSGIAESR